VLAAIAGTPRVLAVIATAAGKSLTFILLASRYGGGTIIVVVPIVTLRADIRRRY